MEMGSRATSRRKESRKEGTAWVSSRAQVGRRPLIAHLFAPALAVLGAAGLSATPQPPPYSMSVHPGATRGEA